MVEVIQFPKMCRHCGAPFHWPKSYDSQTRNIKGYCRKDCAGSNLDIDHAEAIIENVRMDTWKRLHPRSY